MKSYSEALKSVEALLRKIAEILAEEGEGNWTNGINSLIGRISVPAASEDHARDLLLDIFRAYRDMSSGYGSFSDYYLHRSNQADLIRVNDEFDALRAELWRLLMAVFHEGNGIAAEKQHP